MKYLNLIFALFVFSNAQAETWRITSLEWQPYSGPDMRSEGISALKLRRLLRKQGVELEVEFHDWEYSQELAKEKDYVGYFPAWPDEVKPGFIASLPFHSSFVSAIYRKGEKHDWDSYQQLFENNKVGIVETYVYPEEIQKLIDRYPDNVVYAQDERDLANMFLNYKQFKYAVTDPNVLSYHAQLQEKRGAVKAIYSSMMSIPIVVVMRNSPDNRYRIEILNQLIADLDIN